MVLSLNQIIEAVKTIALNHSQVNSFYFGDTWELGSGSKVDLYDGTQSPTPLYPLVGLTLLRSDKAGKQKQTTFNLFVCDLVNKGESNETEVLSDTDLIIQEIHDYLRYYLENTQTTNPANALPDFSWTDFTERFDDEVSGHQGDLTIIQAHTRDVCAIPTRGDIPYTNTNIVLIKDQDGNTIAELQPGSTYTVTIVSAIDGGNATTIFTNTVIGN